MSEKIKELKEQVKHLENALHDAKKALEREQASQFAPMDVVTVEGKDHEWIIVSELYCGGFQLAQILINGEGPVIDWSLTENITKVGRYEYTEES